MEQRSVASAEAPVPTELAVIQRALDEALEDERRSEALYEAVMERVGERRPFATIVHAERRHQAMLLAQYERLGLIPPDEHAFEFEVPDDFVSACVMAADAERENIAIYDRVLSQVTEAGVVAAFERLRAVSLNCHLRAFERHASGDHAGHAEGGAGGCAGAGACGGGGGCGNGAGAGGCGGGCGGGPGGGHSHGG
ncbi:MAG: ferritin-like domain-containing protein [Phycisphaerales bacterium]